MKEIDRSAIDEANRLYWDSSTSVAEIAERLGWSRRALYDAVEPLPTDQACPTCGSPLVYVNRSARSSDTTVCVACETREESAEAGDPQLQRALSAEARDRRERIYAAGAAALVGATTGAALTFLLVRKR
jgi:hypothetical protein